MNSVSNRVVASTGFLLLIQLLQRGLGIISTLILARLLAPEQFGIIALIAIALQFFEILADAGNQHYIIQKAEVTDSDLNTAWTLEIIVKSSMALLIIGSAPIIASYFNAPELTLALWVSSLVLPIKALRNPILMLQARQLNYQPVFKLNLWQKSLSFITVITIAIIWQNYWAIVVGNLVAATIYTFGSYLISQYRPTLSVQQLNEQWGFSKWLMLRGLIGFFRSQIDSLLVSRWFSTKELGGFHLLRELAVMPAVSVVIPAAEPLQAAIADDRFNQAALAYRTRFSLVLMSSLLIPISTFMWLFPEQIVYVLLGKQWLEFAVLLQPFALFFFTFCLFALCSNAYLAVGQAKLLFWFDLISTLIIVTLLIMLASTTLLELTWQRAWLAVITTLVIMLMLEKTTNFNWAKFVTLVTPALFSAALSGLIVLTINELLKLSVYLSFLFNGTLFCLFFASSYLLSCRVLANYSFEGRQYQQHLQRLAPQRLKYLFSI
ncbi:oligosaccharide flippase family protein [Alishewanella sp. HL-SH06]|uniref:oligosaccharide flippase family protein n=1 Tax=Alishewanella sp. HL-SH06 TaxID=3461144 RepID=UPI004042E8BB